MLMLMLLWMWMWMFADIDMLIFPFIFVAQKQVFSIIRMDILPQFLNHLKAKKAASNELQFQLKTGLTEQDKVWECAHLCVVMILCDRNVM